MGPGHPVGVPVWVSLCEGGGMVVCAPVSASEQNQPEIQPEPDQDLLAPDTNVQWQPHWEQADVFHVVKINCFHFPIHSI